MIDKKWYSSLTLRLNQALNIKPIRFSNIKRSALPLYPGVYIISYKKNGKERFIYVGRTKNMQERVYRNHIMGNLKASSLKNYLCKDIDLNAILTSQHAKEYIISNCYVRYIQEDDFYTRGILEYYFTAVLKPKYGISIEH